jgi:hypothetical protein
MTQWTEQDRSYIGAASLLATNHANGDKETLAIVSFAAWCRDMQLSPAWFATWPHVEVGSFTVLPVLDTSPDFDCFATAIEALSETWYAIVRILSPSHANNGKEDGPVVHILGLTAVLDQIQRNPAPHPRHQLLSCREWLKAFPVHHTPYQED